ncbi:MAG: hypothetical protein QOF40_3554, partial [Actinomycetota bacterium]|nr:hypothetical protein [Actinomycetota bacterium]
MTTALRVGVRPPLTAFEHGTESLRALV